MNIRTRDNKGRFTKDEASIGDSKRQDVIVAYKGFDKDMSCRGHKFEVGQTYTVPGKIEACSSGFHACENPFDVWSYYPLEDGNRFAVVELSGDISRHNEDSKIAAASIKVTAELKLPAFITRGVKWLVDHITAEAGKPDSGGSSKLAASGYYSKLAASGGSSNLAASGDYSNLAASGDYSNLAASGGSSNLAASGGSSNLAASGGSSNLAASGYYSKLAASGGSSNLAASGDYSKLAASGYYSKLAASGGSSNLAASGDYINLAASGYYSKLAASGYYSKLAASGDYSNLAASGGSSNLAASGCYSKLDITGDRGVAAASAPGCVARGIDGTWVSLAEFDNDGACVGFATGRIGDGGLKSGTWYRAEGGKLVEA